MKTLFAYVTSSTPNYIISHPIKSSPPEYINTTRLNPHHRSISSPPVCPEACGTEGTTTLLLLVQSRATEENRSLCWDGPTLDRDGSGQAHGVPQLSGTEAFCCGYIRALSVPDSWDRGGSVKPLLRTVVLRASLGLDTHTHTHTHTHTSKNDD